MIRVWWHAVRRHNVNTWHDNSYYRNGWYCHTCEYGWHHFKHWWMRR